MNVTLIIWLLAGCAAFALAVFFLALLASSPRVDRLIENARRR